MTDVAGAGLSWLRRWWPSLVGAAAAVLGAALLASDTLDVVHAHDLVSRLRAHGRRATARARPETSCSQSARRHVECHTSDVQLSFTAAGQQVLTYERPIEGHLYVPRTPHGHQLGAPLKVTVVYDPHDTEQAQVAGALDVGVLDLARRRLVAFVVATLLLAIGGMTVVVRWLDAR